MLHKKYQKTNRCKFYYNLIRNEVKYSFVSSTDILPLLNKADTFGCTY